MAVIIQDFGEVGQSGNVISGEMPITTNVATTINTGITGNKLKRIAIFLDMTNYPNNQEYIIWDSKEPTYYSGWGFDNNSFRYTLNDIRYWGGIISVDTTTGDIVIKAGSSSYNLSGTLTWMAEKTS